MSIQNEQILVNGLLSQLKAQDIAVGIHVDDVILGQLGMDGLHGGLGHIIVVVIGVGDLVAGNTQVGIVVVLVLLHAGDLAGHGLKLADLADDILVILVPVAGEGDQVLFLEALNVELLVVQLGVGHGSDVDVLAIVVALNLGDFAQVVVDLANGDSVLVVIDIDLGHSAVASVLVLFVIALGGNSSGLLQLAVHISGPVILLLVADDLAQVLIDILALGGLSVNEGGLDGGEGADLGLLQLPHVGGTAIDAILGSQLQLGEVLLGELDILVSLDIAVVLLLGDVPLDLLGQGSTDSDLSAVHVGDDLGIILHHGGLQGVQGVQASLFTGNSLVAVEGVLQALVQADADGLLSDLDAEGAGVVVALDVGVIAQSAQQHLHEGIAGQRTGGTEGAVAVAADDALVGAVGDVASKNVVGGNVAEGSDSGAQLSGSGGAEDQVADDLGSLTTVQGSLGLEGTVGITVDDLHSGQHGDGFVIVDFVSVREVLGAGADGDQRHGHNQSQNQRKELLHVVFSSFKIFAIRRSLAPFARFRVSCRG